MLLDLVDTQILFNTVIIDNSIIMYIANNTCWAEAFWLMIIYIRMRRFSICKRGNKKVFTEQYISLIFLCILLGSAYISETDKLLISKKENFFIFLYTSVDDSEILPNISLFTMSDSSAKFKVSLDFANIILLLQRL